MNEYDFREKLAFSKGRAEATDAGTIQSLITGCVQVDESSKELDLRGIDYVATLRGGATLNIDIKAREFGCSAYWTESLWCSTPEPELALETWSVCPTNGFGGKTGWTLDESKLTDYTLHVFDPSDTDEVFLLPFQLLRMAFRENLVHWQAQFRVAKQSSGSWKSECVFVPAWCVIQSIESQMRAKTG